MALIRGKLGRLGVKAQVATALIAALCLALDPEEVAALVGRADPAPLAAAFAVSVVGVLISAEKWRGLLRRAGVRLSLAASARFY